MTEAVTERSVKWHNNTVTMIMDNVAGLIRYRSTNLISPMTLSNTRFITTTDVLKMLKIKLVKMPLFSYSLWLKTCAVRFQCSRRLNGILIFIEI